MPSTAKTHHLKLNQWSLEDKPQMEDFNQDNQLLEDSISAIGKEIADFNKDNQLLENSLSAIRKELEDFKKDNQLLKDSISAIRKEMEDFNKDNQLLENSLPSIRKEMEDINASLANKANKETPKIFALEGADKSIYPSGIGGHYYRTQENMVVVIFHANTVSTGITDGNIGVLPVGYRPTRKILILVELRSSTNGICAGYVNVHPDGTIIAGKFRPAMQTAGVLSMVNGQCVFLSQ